MLRDLRLKIFIVFGLTLSAVSACSHGPTIQEFPDTANASEEMSRLNSDLTSAIAQQVDVLAPENFKQAQSSAHEASSQNERADGAKKMLHELAIGRAYLNRANEFAELSRTNLGEVVAARKLAMDAGAKDVRKNEFEQADHHLIQVTRDIENNHLEGAEKNRQSLQGEYRDVELHVIQQVNLGPAREAIDKAKKEGAKEYAPRTLAIAEKDLAEADLFIVANRHDQDQIKTRSSKTRESADHVLKITRDSKSTRRTTTEDSVLALEGEQRKVSGKDAELGMKQNQLNSKQEQLEDKQGEVDSRDAQIGVLAGERKDLEKDKAFEQRFEDARAQFSDGEAEVYKQGDSLTIRLKNLRFPVSKAALKGADFPVLAKVQHVIEGFGASSVVVEGHTDSDGGVKLNQKLSTERAKAVTEYLVSSNVIERNKISAIGYGYQKPLATNKTAEGKAKNRRVDVIISPVRD